MTVAFQLDGQEFVALNGGPQYKFTEAVSFVVNCQTQEEWMNIGRSSRTEVRKYNAAGSKTNTAYRGKLCRLF